MNAPLPHASMPAADDTAAEHILSAFLAARCAGWVLRRSEAGVERVVASGGRGVCGTDDLASSDASRASTSANVATFSAGPASLRVQFADAGQSAAFRRDACGRETLHAVLQLLGRAWSAEAALSKAASHHLLLEQAFEAFPFPAFVVDRQHRYVVQNEADRAAFGDLRGLTIDETGFSEDHKNEWRGLHDRVLAGTPYRAEMTKNTATGRIIAETAIEPITTGTGVVGLVGISIDRTDRLRAQEALEASQTRLRDWLAVSSDWIFETDADDRFVLVMGDSEKHGLAFETWIGRPAWEIADGDPSTGTARRAIVDAFGAREPIVNLVVALRDKGGERVFAEVSARPLLSPEGTFVGYRGAARDVSERERLVERLRRSDTIATATRNAILVMDPARRILWANPAFEEMTGYRLGEALGRTPAELLRCCETDPATAASIDEAIAFGREARAQLLNQAKDGRRYWLDIRIQPVFADDGTYQGAIAVETDVTELVEARVRVASILENAPTGILVQDETGRIKEANAEACRLLGLPLAEILGRSALDPEWQLVDGSGEPLVGDRHPAARAMVEGSLRNVLIGVRHANGTRRWLRVNVEPIRFGSRTELFSSFIDVTDEEDRRREVEEARGLLRDVIETIPDAISVYDTQDRLVLFNEAYRRLYERAAPVVRVGARFEDVLLHGLENGQYPDAGDTPRRRNAYLERRLSEHRRADNTPNVQALPGGGYVQRRERRSGSGLVVAVRTDITALKTAEAAIRRAAETDALTGLANRVALLGALDGAVMRRRGNERLGALILIDIDHFKSINDVYGHLAGDELLRVTARRVRSCVRAGDVVARLGGDEMAVLVTGLRDESDLARVLRQVHETTSVAVDFGGRTMTPGVSMGAAVFPVHARTVGDLFKAADEALYEAKQRGRNGWVAFNPALRESRDRRHHLADALRSALEEGGIEVAFQPQIAASDGRHVGFEALARWTLDGEAISPAEFVPIAEEFGLASALGCAVMEKAVARQAQLRKKFTRAGYVAVNVGTTELKDPGFPVFVEDLLRRHGLPPEALEIEVTENVLLDRAAAQMEQALLRLSGLGVQIALDDFGTGYASLSHLKRFPVSRLKIDQTFVRDIEVDAGDAVIVRTIVNLAHSLGMSVIAEGVETQAQKRFLVEAGCDLLQGYLLSRPMSDRDAITEWLAREVPRSERRNYRGAPIPE